MNSTDTPQLAGPPHTRPFPELDVDLRAVPLNYITREAIETFRLLPPGGHFVLTSDHDPVNLLSHLRNMVGDAVTWRVVEQAPKLFRVEVAKDARADQGPP